MSNLWERQHARQCLDQVSSVSEIRHKKWSVSIPFALHSPQFIDNNCFIPDWFRTFCICDRDSRPLLFFQKSIYPIRFMGAIPIACGDSDVMNRFDLRWRSIKVLAWHGLILFTETMISPKSPRKLRDFCPQWKLVRFQGTTIIVEFAKKNHFQKLFQWTWFHCRFGAVRTHVWVRSTERKPFSPIPSCIDWWLSANQLTFVSNWFN